MSEIDFELELDDEPQQPSGQALIPSTDAADDQREVAQVQLSEWIGQRKFSVALQKLLTVSDLVELQKVKESKAYKGLVVVIAGKVQTVSSFKQVCDSIGVSEQHVSEQLLNLKTFGPEFIEYSDKHLGFRDVRALRKLPDDEREALIEVAKAGDKDQLLDLAESLIEKHAREKETLRKEIADKHERLEDMENNKDKQVKNLESEIEYKDALINKMKQRDNRDYEFHWKTHTVREECLAHQAECEVALNSLQAIFNEQLNDIELTEKDLRIEQLWITANVVAARAAGLVEHIRLQSLVDLPDAISSKHRLTDDEAQRWLLEYPMIERKSEAAKAMREDARPNRPGRPKKGQ